METQWGHSGDKMKTQWRHNRENECTMETQWGHNEDTMGTQWEHNGKGRTQWRCNGGITGTQCGHNGDTISTQWGQNRGSVEEKWKHNGDSLDALTQAITLLHQIGGHLMCSSLLKCSSMWWPCSNAKQKVFLQHFICEFLGDQSMEALQHASHWFCDDPFSAQHRRTVCTTALQNMSEMPAKAHSVAVSICEMMPQQ